MSTIWVALIVFGLFFAAILNLALATRVRSAVMGLSAIVSIVIGVLFYSNAYIRAGGFSMSAVFRTLLTVCRMFGGVNDAAALSGTPLFQLESMVALFWLGHFLAFYVTASAAIEVLGRQLLKTLRTRLLRHGQLTIVYGATADTVSLVKRGSGVLFVADEWSASASELADARGGVLFTGGAAKCATPGFLKSIGVGGGGRSIDLYCLCDDAARNLRFAEAMSASLAARQVPPEAASAFILGVSEEKAARLQALDGRYGYGALMAAESPVLMARMLVRKMPPWTLVRFDGEGRAMDDFRVVIVGFGQMGRAAFFQMVANGQMEGSTFHAEIFDPRIDCARGYLNACYPELMRQYDIVLNGAEAGSEAFYHRLEEVVPGAILLCTGSQKQNAELAADLERLYAVRRERPVVAQCTGEALRLGDQEYRLGSVDVREIDRRAMIINHRYSQGPSPEADWQRCDPFSRASSRASADFCPAYLRAAGVDRASALIQWPPKPAMLENLARTEHLRWCAFHLTMGYRPMSPEEFEDRARRVRQGEAIRVSKDTEARTHACLTPWEALDELSELENRVTDRQVDYKAMDVNNVLALPEILKLEDAGKKRR